MTLFQIINYKYVQSPEHVQDFFSKFIPFLSPVIVIVTFWINNRYTVKTKKAESLRTWYFKAYFENQVKKIEDFFSNADNLMKLALVDYNASFNFWSVEYKTEFVGATLLALADLKRKFEIEVIEGLKHTYPDIFNDIEKKMMNFEDAGTKAFEVNQEEDNYFKYLSDIHSIKSELIISLSKPALQ